MKGRVKLYFIFVLLGIFGCNRPPSGRMVSFEDYKLHIKVRGTGDPTVIIEGGLACRTNFYDGIFDTISGLTSVISYDHAGIGYSTPSPNKRTLPNYVKELHQLLIKENLTPPYILVGHSIGGFIIRYYTYKYPKDVVGLVFIDQPPDDWFEYIRATHSSDDILKFNKWYDPDQTIHYEGVPLEELKMYETNTSLLKGIKIPSQIPVRMVTSIQYGAHEQEAGYHPDDMMIWAKMQAKVLEGVSDAKQILTKKSGHFVQETEPGLIVNEIKDLVNKFRSSK